MDDKDHKNNRILNVQHSESNSVPEIKKQEVTIKLSDSKPSFTYFKTDETPKSSENLEKTNPVKNQEVTIIS